MNASRSLILASALVIGSSLAVIVPAGPAFADTLPVATGRVSAPPGGSPVPAGDSRGPTVSPNGRYVAFSTTARLDPADVDDVRDVYVKDLLTERVERISVTPDGSAADNPSLAGALSHDGRYVAFTSTATNLVPGVTQGVRHVYVRDRAAGTTVLASASSSGDPGDFDSGAPTTGAQRSPIDISADGRFVTFGSSASTLVPGVTSANQDVFVRDLVAGSTELVSVAAFEPPAKGWSAQPSMSADGRYVAFVSLASNLTAGDTNARTDIFVRDRQTGSTTLVSRTQDGGQINEGASHPTISDSGTRIAFWTLADNVTPNDTPASADIFLRDTTAATTTRVTLAAGGQPLDGNVERPELSADGTTVVYASNASNLVSGPMGPGYRVYAWRQGQTTLASVPVGAQAGAPTASDPAVSADGRTIAFSSSGNFTDTTPLGGSNVWFRRTLDLGGHATVAGFVSTHLQGFKGSVPAAEATAAVAAIEAGASPERYLVALANDPAFASPRAPMVRLYVAYFKRLPDPSGLAYWVKRRQQGTTLDAISRHFARSSEFTSKYGSTSHQQFVTLVYLNVFDRQPDPAGLAFWVKRLQGGMSRGQLMTHFSESSEGVRRFAPWVQPVLLSLGMRGSLAPASLLTTMSDLVRADSPEAAARALLSAP